MGIKEKVSPMMRHYLEVKESFPDALLFYRLGDFYELFFEDAVVASKALEIALTGRDCGLDKRAEMCGVPFHSAEKYISKTIYKTFNKKKIEKELSINLDNLQLKDIIR